MTPKDHSFGIQTVNKASQSSLRQQRKESEIFSAGACTWQKIQLGLQVRCVAQRI